MNGKILVLFFAFTSVACAQPKYEVASPSQGGVNGSANTCAARFSKSGLCLFWNWETLPTSRTQGSLSFKVYRDDSSLAVDLPSVPEVVLWMPSMGHGSSPTTVRHVSVGGYEVTNVFFVMPGEWEIKFQVREGTTVVDEAIIPLNF